MRGLPVRPRRARRWRGSRSRRRHPRRCTCRRGSAASSAPTTAGVRSVRPSRNLASTDITAIAVSPRSPDTVLAGRIDPGASSEPTTAVGTGRRSPASLASPRWCSCRRPVGGSPATATGSDPDHRRRRRHLDHRDRRARARRSRRWRRRRAPPRRPCSPGTLSGHLLRSTDGGSSFSPIASGLPTDQISGLATSPDYDRDHTVWASLANHGVYRSTDRGQTWTRTSRGLSTDMQAHVVKVAEFRGISAASGAHGTELYEAGFDGLFHSWTAARTWKESQTLVDFITGLDVSPEYANDRTVAAATYVKGVYLSTDAGRRWSPSTTASTRSRAPGNKYATIRRLHNITLLARLRERPDAVLRRMDRIPQVDRRRRELEADPGDEAVAAAASVRARRRARLRETPRAVPGHPPG